MAINKNILLKYEAATDDNTVYFIVVLSSLWGESVLYIL